MVLKAARGYVPLVSGHVLWEARGSVAGESMDGWIGGSIETGPWAVLHNSLHVENKRRVAKWAMAFAREMRRCGGPDRSAQRQSAAAIPR